MVDQFVVLMGSSPCASSATTAFSLVRRLVQANHTVQVCLMQDGALAGLDAAWANAARAQAPGAKFSVLDEDLALRGFGPQNLAQGIDCFSYAKLVEVLMGDGVHVIGML
jgi:sulfur relay protein TusB/DsrH